jgi:hypothetical protein
MEEGLPKNPKLELAQLKFLIKRDKKNDATCHEKLKSGIIEDSNQRKFRNF